MERGGAVRATGETKMNEVSSRSHAVFIVIAEQSETVYVDENGAEVVYWLLIDAPEPTLLYNFNLKIFLVSMHNFVLAYRRAV